MRTLPYSPAISRTQYFFQKKHSILFLGILAGIYVVFQVRFLVFGNTLRIYTPKEKVVFTREKSILFSGNAYRAEKVTLGGTILPIDSKGYFEKNVFLPPGETLYILSIENSFGKIESKTITIIKTS